MSSSVNEYNPNQRLRLLQDGDEAGNGLIQLCIGNISGAVVDDSFVRRESPVLAPDFLAKRRRPARSLLR
jgi:hypothetical protein